MGGRGEGEGEGGDGGEGREERETAGGGTAGHIVRAFEFSAHVDHSAGGDGNVTGDAPRAIMTSRPGYISLNPW
ncbi:hypothetical protein GCM10010350_43800 [Streptomyces galilaeus]|nr:hypothetical protein GCM10010350_43800 [Streptomyces galilaeus]